MKKIESFFSKTIAYVMLFVMSGLTIVSFIEDAYLKTDYVEKIYYKADSLVLNCVFIIFLITVLIMACRKKVFEKISVKWLLIGIILFSALVCSIWVIISHSVPRADSQIVLKNIDRMARGDYTALTMKGYLRKHQQQLGLCLFLETIFKIFTDSQVNYHLVRAVNVVMICAIFCGMHLIMRELTKNKIIITLELIFSFGWLPLMLYAVFVYGVVPGLFCAVFGIWCMLKYMNTDKLLYGVGMVILLSGATVFKKNYLVFVIAIMIVLAIKALVQKRWKYLVLIVAIFGSITAMNRAVIEIYEYRSQIELMEPMPSTAYIAMGMQEGPIAEGWYNGYHNEIFKSVDYDSKKTSEISKDYINQRIQEFINNPKECVQFYYKKIFSQWNEATYESIWIARDVYGESDKELGKIATSVFEGSLHKLIIEWMDLYQLLLYFGTTICLWELRKNKDMKNTILILCILGGVLFHILWEGKSQYIFPYVTLMIPCAAIGYTFLIENVMMNINNKNSIKVIEKE